MQLEHPYRTNKKIDWGKAICSIVIVWMVLLTANATVTSSSQYTDKQLDALASRVGKIFWINPQSAKSPTFLSAPAANAATFNPGRNESFEITDLAGRANKDPYLADEKRHLDEQTSEETKRVDWIKSQPWSPAVKEAAIKKQPTPGLNTAEVKRVLGAPRRVTKLRGLTKVAEEHWFYPDGSVLIFNNGLLTRTEKAQTN